MKSSQTSSGPIDHTFSHLVSFYQLTIKSQRHTTIFFMGLLVGRCRLSWMALLWAAGLAFVGPTCLCFGTNTYTAKSLFMGNAEAQEDNRTNTFQALADIKSANSSFISQSKLCGKPNLETGKDTPLTEVVRRLNI